jgi:transposase-like protein
MANKRNQYSAEFKAKVTLDAVRGEKTVPQLASHYGVHPTVINTWKRQLLEGVSGIFEAGSSTTAANSEVQSQINELYRTIGQLKVERDFLANRSARLGMGSEKPWS